MELKESVLLLPTRLTVMTSLALSALKTRRVEAVVAHVDKLKSLRHKFLPAPK